jgi:predicted Zn-dependent protease
MHSLIILLLVPALLSLAGCTTNPATGHRSFTAFMSPEEEARVGRQEHPKLVQQFGGRYGDPSLSSYVSDVGQSLARVTEQPNQSYSFTVLDDELVNAFALPGGYVHVTRGLLALASDEAEMASVLAHELGHVTARHAAERYSQGVLAQVGAGVAAVAGAAAGIPIGDAAGGVAQAYVQSYSRDQEFEADKLGLRYMSRVGYDPQAMVRFFRKLDAYTQLQAAMAGDPGAADRFSIMASHPRTGDRVAQAMQLANTIPPGARKDDGRERYLDAIDGMIFGDSAEDGVRRGRRFDHPKLRIGFQVPPGFVMFNSPQQVIARGPGNAVIVFDGETRPGAAEATDDMGAYITRVWAQPLNLASAERFTADGMDAATATTRVKTRAGGVVDLRLVAIREAPGRIYRFMFLTPPAVTQRMAPQFLDTVKSFRRLSAAEAAAIKPLKVRVVTVKPGDTPESLAASMPFGEQRVNMFRILNGLPQGTALTPGQRVKIIVG